MKHFVYPTHGSTQSLHLYVKCMCYICWDMMTVYSWACSPALLLWIELKASLPIRHSPVCKVTRICILTKMCRSWGDAEKPQHVGLYFNNLANPQESLSHVTNASAAPAFLCLVSNMWGNPIHSLWNYLIYSDSVSSLPTPHNDPCCSVSQPFSTHQAPSGFTFSLLMSGCFFFCSPQPLLWMCLFLCLYNPNPHAIPLIQPVWEY